MTENTKESVWPTDTELTHFRLFPKRLKGRRHSATSTHQTKYKQDKHFQLVCELFCWDQLNVLSCKYLKFDERAGETEEIWTCQSTCETGEAGWEEAGSEAVRKQSAGDLPRSHAALTWCLDNGRLRQTWLTHVREWQHTRAADFLKIWFLSKVQVDSFTCVLLYICYCGLLWSSS